MNERDWLATADELLIKLIGLDRNSMEDWCWEDAFRDGLEPYEAVNQFCDDMNLPYFIET